MDMSAYKDEIRLKLTGDILELELDDSALEKVINSAFREIQRYIDTTRLATILYKPCIDLTGTDVSSVSRVFRANEAGYSGIGQVGTLVDPLYASQ